MKFSSKIQRCELSPMRKFHPFAVEAQNKGRKIYHLNIEKDLRRIVIHLSGMASSELVVYGSFHDLIPNLDERFLYCHRSYIINMDEIIIMSHNQILLSSNEGIYFGKDTYRKAQKTFEEYMQRKRKEFS